MTLQVDAPAPVAAPRERLLDAALTLLAETPWTSISMARIAAAAGVSRQTLYNEFGSREVYAQAFALREADKFLQEVEAPFRAHADDPIRALSEGLTAFLTRANENPMVKQIVVREPGADELFALFTTAGGPVVELATARLADLVQEQWSVIDEADTRALCQLVVRLGISFAGLPAPSIEGAVETVVRVIEPFALSILARTAV